MPATRKILTSIEGKRMGLSSFGELVVDGHGVKVQNDQGVMLELMEAPLALDGPGATFLLKPEHLFHKYVNATPVLAMQYKLPTGAAMQSYINDAGEFGKRFRENVGFRWELANLATASNDDITITSNSGHLIVGFPIVPSLAASTGVSTAQWRTRRVADNQFITYRS
jgi:hypothetical protein